MNAKSLRAVLATVLCALFIAAVGALSHAAEVKPATWQADWDKTLKAAEQEGQVTYSGCGSHEFLGEFQKKYPKIKVESVAASCSEVISRIMAERRAGKYLTDVVRFGLTSAHTFYRGKLLQPINTSFILPEVKDTSKWWLKKHHYSDPEGKYLSHRFFLSVVEIKSNNIFKVIFF
jgi:spermidine/putrescine-binding protein